jgi:hypothetical protein
MSRRVALLSSIITVALALVAPAAAGANAYTRVYKAYTKAGSLAPCEFKAATLSAALHQTPPYELQYLAQFPEAIQGALNAQDAGVCAAGAGSVNPLGGPGAPRRGSGGGPLPKSVSASSSAGVPLAFALLGALGALLAIGGVWYAVARRAGVQSSSLTDWRHACAEAGYRLSARWADLTDRPRSRGRRHARPARPSDQPGASR